MQHYSIEELRKSEKFIKSVRWDITPKKFLSPDRDEPKPEGFMLYVDMVYHKPAVVIMKLKRTMSKTVGYINDIPEDLVIEATKCAPEECVAGMYPLTERLREWLKRELGLS